MFVFVTVCFVVACKLFTFDLLCLVWLFDGVGELTYLV